MIHVERGGEGPVLVLLHGLGATGDVWDGVVAHWPGSWVVPDLPGHGRSSPLDRYSIGSLAAAVASIVPAGRVAVIGHSLGGAVALALASGWFGVEVTAVAGLGIKVRWTPEELAKSQEVAARPVKVFATREEAVERASRMAGVPLSHGIVETAGGWRIALDTKAFGVGAPDMAGLIGTARAKIVLAAGEHDPMCPQEHLDDLVPDPVVLPGLGHNAHVEDPSALVPLLTELNH